jgi:D-arabinose 5-phosphate isomerase GutQ
VGRSGLVVQAFGQRLMHLGFDVHLAHEITARPSAGAICWWPVRGRARR